jgi:putative addiction module component (TIGR02574 family)
MTERAQEIKTTIATLSHDDQVELAHFLLDRISQEEDSGWAHAWVAELDRREEDVKNGKAAYEPAEEALAELKKPFRSAP